MLSQRVRLPLFLCDAGLPHGERWGAADVGETAQLPMSHYSRRMW